MFAQRIGVGIALLAIAGVLLFGAAAVGTHPAFAAMLTTGKGGGTVSGSVAAMKAVPRQDKTVGGHKALPGHGDFCYAKAKSEIARSIGTGRGQVVMKTTLPGHGGFLAPGEEC